MSRDSATRPKRRPGRRLAACALAFLGLFGLGTGSASQFPLAGTAVSAGSAMIAPCQGSAPITATFTSDYDASHNRYSADHVRLTGINAACSTLGYRFRVITTTGYLDEETGTVTASGATDNEGITDTRVTNIVSIQLVIP